MLIWVCALHCEAKPVIDFYRLKKDREQTAFDLYRHQGIICVVSGMGQINAAAATAWVGGLFDSTSVIGWINLGVAGSKDADIGSAFMINKIIDETTNRASYPVPLKQNKLDSIACQTLSQTSTDYPAQGLIDMEASAFFNTATRFSSAELVQSIKVVSDNAEQEPSRDKPQLSALIESHLQALASVATKLESACQQQLAVSLSKSDLQAFLQLAHFTSTQQSQLKKALLCLLSQNHHVEQLLDLTRQCKNSQQILACLKQQLEKQSVKL